jgi:hypothetical protein
MSLHFPIRVPSDLLEELGAFTGNSWSDSLALEPYICEAIRNYLVPPPAQPQPAQPTPPADLSCELGYQWKEVFLPEGTRLRANFDKKPYFATVHEAEIRYGEHAVSPSCFANLYGSGNRNAWKAVWLRFPGSDAWLLADVCRGARKASITRLLTTDAREDKLPPKAEWRQSEQPAPPPRSAPASQSALPSTLPSALPPAPPSWLPPKVVAPAAGRRAPLEPRLTDVQPPGKQAAQVDRVPPGHVAGKRARRRKRRAKKSTAAN